MFSMTDSLVSALVSWKVRTIPWRARPCDLNLSTSLPLKTTDPVSGRSKPVSRLKKVVLPAPLGPINAVITPRWISR